MATFSCEPIHAQARLHRESERAEAERPRGERARKSGWMGEGLSSFVHERGRRKGRGRTDREREREQDWQRIRLSEERKS
eukprot:513260-Pleurochrysis_carterae.AAC.1